MKRLAVLLLLAVITASPPGHAADKVEDLLRAARDAARQSKAEEALALANKAVELEPKNASAWLARGVAHGMLRQPDKAVRDFDEALRLRPDLADAYHQRGCEHFKLGHIKESLADFDKYLELRPAAAPGHWQRGITLYYAGRFEDGKKQFASYEKVDANDVENAVWHYLCNARAHGVEKARKEILKIGNDRRVPMMQVYALYAGRARPEDVLTAAHAGKPDREELNKRLFYAHLYLGLYYEAAGDRKKALEHISRAADEHKIGHYMGDVARVHRDLLKK